MAFFFQFVVSVCPQWFVASSRNYLGPLCDLSCPTNNSSGKNFLRAAQMNMNFATWGHLMMSILPRYSSFTTFSSSPTATPDLLTNHTPRSTVKEHQTSTPLPRLELTEHLEPPERGLWNLKLSYFGCFAVLLQFSDSALKRIRPLPPA